MQSRKDELLRISAEHPDNLKANKKAEMYKVTDSLTYFNLQVHLNDCFGNWTPISGLRGVGKWDDVLEDIKC